jgi:hypothetical protein
MAQSWLKAGATLVQSWRSLSAFLPEIQQHYTCARCTRPEPRLKMRHG